MKANALLKWLVPAALLGVVLIILKPWVPGGSTPSHQCTHRRASSLGRPQARQKTTSHVEDPTWLVI
ncbi:hypothetical protein, partial [Pseudomonas psychrophila]|uniref:hypothetical protein n=1 Tax=Pseudomonas psychrophila TaxID=122355 RepID=UPI0037F77538